MKTKKQISTLLGAVLIAVMLLAGTSPSLVSAAPGPLPDSTACVGLGTGTVSCELWAGAGTISLPGAPAPVPVWGFSGAVGGPFTVPGPYLMAHAGDTVTVTLHNTLAEAVSIDFKGIAMAPDFTGAAAGGDQVYTFTPAEAGSFLYEAGLLADSEHQVAMGLYGALIVRPAGGLSQALSDAGTAFNDEALVIMSEIDLELNNSASPAGFDMRNYNPKYFLINGKAYPQTDVIPTTPGNTVLLRYLNAGQLSHTMLVSGVAYQTFLTDNSVPMPFYKKLVSELLEPAETADALVTIPTATVPGSRFALYDGSLLLHNNGAAGFGGMLTFLQAGTAGTGSDTVGPAITSLAAAPNPTNGTAAVTITAAVNDAVTGGSNITAVEYMIDSTMGTPVAMTAQDGSFDSPTEVATAVLSVADLAALSSGIHTIYVHAQDSATNWDSFNYIALNLDKTGPMVKSIAFTPPVSNGSAAVKLSATADDSASGGSYITAAEYTLDGGAATAMMLGSVGPIRSLSATISAATMAGLAEGTHAIAIRAQDALGNWGTWAPASLLVDKTGPAAQGLQLRPNPTNGKTGYNPITPSLRLDAQLSDPVVSGAQSNIKTGEVYIDTDPGLGKGLKMTPLDGLFNTPTEAGYAWIPLTQINAMTPGVHTVFVRGQDSSGNWGAAVSIQLIIDKTGPVMSGLAASPNPTNTTVAPLSNNVSFTLTGTATDVYSNVAAAEWFEGADPGQGFGYAMNAADGSWNGLVENVTTTINFVTLDWAAGAHTLSVRSKDAAGNWGAVSTVVVNVVLPNNIFADSFESNNFAAWSANTGSIVVNTASRLGPSGTYGMQATVTGGATGYVTDNTPRLDASYYARFYFHPHSVLTGNNNAVTIFTGRNAAGTSIFEVQMRRQNAGGGTYQIRGVVLRSGGTSFTNWYNITNASHYISISWTSGSAGAGSLRLYRDGTLLQSILNINTSAYLLDSVRLGPSAGVAAGSSGSMYFDVFASTRRTALTGPAAVAAAQTAASLPRWVRLLP